MARQKLSEPGLVVFDFVEFTGCAVCSLSSWPTLAAIAHEVGNELTDVVGFAGIGPGNANAVILIAANGVAIARCLQNPPHEIK